MGPFAKECADLAGKEAAERDVVCRCERSDRFDSGGDQPLFGAGTDSRKDPDWERREERRFVAGPDGGESSGLPPVGGNLRDDLGCRDTKGARQACAGAHDGTDRFGERARVVEGWGDLPEIEVALVDSRLLDGWNHLVHDRPDGL